MKIEDIPDEMIVRICTVYRNQLYKYGDQGDKNAIKNVREKLTELKLVCPECGKESEYTEGYSAGSFCFECERCRIQSPEKATKEEVVAWMDNYRERMGLEEVKFLLRHGDKVPAYVKVDGTSLSEAEVEKLYIKRKPR